VGFALGQIYDVSSHNPGRLFQFLEDIRKTLSTFDTSDIRRGSGSLLSDYVQDKTKGKGYISNRSLKFLSSLSINLKSDEARSLSDWGGWK